MKTNELQRLTVKELHDRAKTLKIKEFSGLRKQDLIKLILVIKKVVFTVDHVLLVAQKKLFIHLYRH